MRNKVAKSIKSLCIDNKQYKLAKKLYTRQGLSIEDASYQALQTINIK